MGDLPLIFGAVKWVPLSVKIYVGVPYFKITSLVRNSTAVVAVQSLTALVITNFHKMSVKEIMYLFPFRDVGVMGP